MMTVRKSGRESYSGEEPYVRDRTALSKVQRVIGKPGCDLAC